MHARPSPTPAHNRSKLASSTARRQGSQLSWSFAGVLTLLLSYAVAQALFQQGWVTPQFAQTVLWCSLPYALAAHWIYRGAGLPAAERGSLLIVTTVTPFLLLLLGFALLQQPYSRGAVLLVYVLSTVWFSLGDRLQHRHRTQRLAFLDAGIPAELDKLCGPEVLRNRDIELVPLQLEAPGADVFFAFDGVVLDRHVGSCDLRSKLLGRLKLSHVRLYNVEAVAELLSGRKMLPADMDELWQLDGNPAYDLAKRAIDVAVVLAFTPLWLPLCFLVGLGVKADTPGPVLFSQYRVGRDGHSFRLWKFRSMRHQSQPEGARFALPEDERITRVGRRIRRWRLDELPQLWNVLWGQMSLIGPRPEQTQFVEAFSTRIPAYTYRHLVRPGLTGWAQMQQGYADSEEETVVKLSYDLYYVAHYSMALDLLIAYKTVRTILNGFGAR